MRRRVKITGIGPVTPAGIGREAFFRGINEPVSRVRRIVRAAPEQRTFIGAEIVDFDIRTHAPGRNPRRMSRHTQFGLAAALLALADAKITPHQTEPLNPLISTGTSLMDFDRITNEVNLVARRGPNYALARNLYETALVNVPGKIAELFEVKPRMLVLQTSCCSGLDAVGQAFEQVAAGQTDFAVAGGTESPLTYHPLVEFDAADLNPSCLDAPEKSCRPFDLWRSTGVLGEGAAMFILEPESSPRPAIAWITGYGISTDDIAPGSGIAGAVRDAIRNAGRRPDEIDFINAWGPGHRSIDTNEARAFMKIFNGSLRNIPVASIKGAIGTALGAAGAIQTASTALSLKHGLIPPTVNWETPDPDCPLNLSAHPRHLAPAIAVVSSHGMAGSNAAIVLEKSCQR